MAALLTDSQQRRRETARKVKSLLGDEHFLGVVQLGYVANLFAYAVDRVQNGKVMEHGVLSPLGRALTFAPSSASGKSTWESRGARPPPRPEARRCRYRQNTRFDTVRR